MVFRLWQEGPGYDRNLQTCESVQALIDYLHHNPVKRGLCQKARDWRWSSALGVPFSGLIAIVLAASGVILLAYGYAVAFRFDPNEGNPESRRELGKKYSVWGEALNELLAASQATVPNHQSNGSGRSTH